MTDNGNLMQPAAYACKEQLTFTEGIPANELKARTDDFLFELTGALKSAGCKLIGHVKGLIDAGDQGHFLFSVTTFEERAHGKGKMTDGTVRAELTMNVIVYGIEKTIVDEVFQNIFNKHFGS